MSLNKVTVICHWGGNIVNNIDTGMNYVGGEKRCIRVKPDILYRQLLSKIYSITGIDRGSHQIRMTCRFPEYFDTHCTFTSLEIMDNSSVDAMLSAVVESSRLTCIHLYIDIVNASRSGGGNVATSTSIVEPLPTIHEYNPVQGDVATSTSIVEPLYTLHDYNPFPTEHQDFQVSQSPSYMPVINEEAPWSAQDHSAVLSQWSIQPQTYSTHLFPDLNAPPSTSGPVLSDSGRMESVRRLVLADNAIEANQSISDEDDMEMSGDNESSDDGMDVNDNNGDDHQECGEPSTATQRMYEPIAPFFTNVEDFVQPIGVSPSESVHSSIFNPQTDELRTGLRFKDKRTLQDAVKRYHIYKECHFYVRNTNTTCWEALCKYRDTTDCLWRLRGSIQKRHGLFEIVTYNGPHTCTFPKMITDHKHLTASLICTEVQALVKDSPSYKVSSIVTLLREKYNFTTTYQKAWNAKQQAIAMSYGDWDKSYSLLPKFLGAIKKYNEGTIVHYTTARDSENHGQAIFRRVFWAFAPCIEGFKYCRPVISIDATHLYGKYKGKILIAMGKDANDQLFPLAFAIVDEESKHNWGWFLKILRKDVVGDRPGICLISDRHRGILAAVQDVGNGWDSSIAHHRFCLRHVCSNFNTKFKNPHLKKLMEDAGNALEIRHFNLYLEQIKGINIKAWEYVMRIPPEKWTMSHDGGYRFGDATTNISESFNGVLKTGRCLPITACVEATFFKCVAYFEKRRAEGLKAQREGKYFTPEAMARLEGNSFRSGNVTVHSFNRDTGEAAVISASGSQHVVCIMQGTCTCAKWQTYKVPCDHAIQVMAHLHINSWQYVSEYYTIASHLQTWAPKFHPLYPEEYWDTPSGRIWIPDKMLKREKGRPRSTRILNEMDIRAERTSNRCGICREAGHDRRTCPEKGLNTSAQ